MKEYFMKDANNDLDLIKFGLYSLKFNLDMDETKRLMLVKTIKTVFADVNSYFFEKSLKMENKTLGETMRDTLRLISEGIVIISSYEMDQNEMISFLNDILQLFVYLDLMKERIEGDEQTRIQNKI